MMAWHMLELCGLPTAQQSQFSKEIKLRSRKKGQVTKEDIAWADIILGRPDPKLLSTSEKPCFLQLDCAGSEAYVDVMPEKSTLCNASGCFGIAISEYVLCGILMLMRNMPQYQRNQRAHRWQMEGPIASLYHANVMIVGMGDLGREIAKRMKGMEANTYGICRRVRKAAYFDEVHAMREVTTLLPQMDVVIMALPSTKETRHCVSAQWFAHMKETAIFVNVGRGDVVATEVITKALITHQIGGALLDVQEEEPLLYQHPLWDMEQVILTPHISGTFQSEEAYARFLALAQYNIHAYIHQQPLKNVVDCASGYRSDTSEDI